MPETFESFLPGSGKNGFLDQLPTNVFALTIDGVIVGTFQTCSGLTLEWETANIVQSTKDGKQINVVMPVKPKFNPITLKHAMDSSTALFDWYMLVDSGKVADMRKNCSVIVYGPDGSTVEQWDFRNAWPSAWKTNDLNAAGSDYMTEEVTIQHEGVKRMRKK
jgi:phage tail-like protein